MTRNRSASSARDRRPAKSVKHIPDHLIDFSEIPESTEAELARATRVGRPKTGAAKQLIAFRIDPVLLAKLRQLAAKEGRPYQTVLHEILEHAGKDSAKQSTDSDLNKEISESRLNALRETALVLLAEVEALTNTQSPRANPSSSLLEEVKRFEIDLIRAALDKTGGNQTRAARLLGVRHTTLSAKIKRYKIPAIALETKVNNKDRDGEVAA